MSVEHFNLYGWQKNHPHPGDYATWSRKRAHDLDYIEVLPAKHELIDTVGADLIEAKGFNRACELLGVSEVVLAAWRQGRTFSTAPSPAWRQEHSLAVQRWEIQMAQAVFEWYSTQLQVDVSFDVVAEPFLEFARTNITDRDGDSVTADLLGYVALAIVRTCIACMDRMGGFNG